MSTIINALGIVQDAADKFWAYMDQPAKTTRGTVLAINLAVFALAIVLLSKL